MEDGHGFDGEEFNQSTVLPSEEMPSPEDVAWADSCLVNDLDTSSKGWDSWSSFSYALSEVSTSRGDPSPAMLDISRLSRDLSTSQNMDATVDDIFMPREETDEHSVYHRYRDSSTSQNLDATDDDISMPREETDEHGIYQLSTDNIYLHNTRFNLKNVFRPTYSEEVRDDGGTNDSEESKAMGHLEEESLENIFKVWNLETPTEDDEFIKQLSKAYSESSLELSSPKGLQNESIDDVISGLANLSLNRVSL